MNRSKTTCAKCFIPSCKNTTTNSRHKLFVLVKETLKKKWCEEVNVEYKPERRLLCCEDHLNLEEDLENYQYFKLMKRRPVLKATAKLHNLPSCSKDETKTIAEPLPTLKSLLLKPIENFQMQKPPEITQDLPSCSITVEVTNTCDDDDNSDTLVESNVCRVCLALDVKMYDLKDVELREMFQNITGILITENNHSILERLCWECAGRLKAAAAFRNKALLSDVLLQSLASTSEQIRKNDITLIKENKDYLKLAGTLSIVKVFHTVEIDPEYVPSLSENNDTDIVRKHSIEFKESIVKENNDQMDVEDESMIEVPIKTEIEYDPICPNTGEGQINIVLETNPLFSNNIPLREDTVNSSPPPGCSHVEPKYPITGYLLKTPIDNSDCENKIKKTEIKITNRDSISKIVSKTSKEVTIHDHTLKGDAKLKNINLKVGGISKKTSKQKLVKKTQVKTNTSIDEEYLSLENFEF